MNVICEKTKEKKRLFEGAKIDRLHHDKTITRLPDKSDQAGQPHFLQLVEYVEKNDFLFLFRRFFSAIVLLLSSSNRSFEIRVVNFFAPFPCEKVYFGSENGKAAKRCLLFFKREKSIRDFCPHRRWGIRQSLIKRWGLENLKIVYLLCTWKQGKCTRCVPENICMCTCYVVCFLGVL